jgi:hypothetical protein
MATYPFSRAKPAGWAFGEKLTSAQQNIVDDNAASGADGSLWTDYMIGMNYPFSATVTDHGRSPIWVDSSTRIRTWWYSFGVSGGNPLAAYSSNGSDWATGLTIAAGDGLTPATRGGSATNGSTIIVGGVPGSSSTSKIRISTDGETFTAANTTATGTIGVTCATYHSGAALFVIGLDNAATTNIETSPDGSTWTQRTTPNSDTRRALATNGTIMVCVSDDGVSNCITSTDGVTWTERTLPQTGTWNDIIWNSFHSRFFIFGDYVLSSADGITWAEETSFLETVTAAASIGRVFALAGGDIYVGYADSSTFDMYNAAAAVFSSGSTRDVAVGNSQFLVTTSTGVHYKSLRGGTPTWVDTF